MTASPVRTPPAIHVIQMASRVSGVIAALMIFSSVLITCQMIWMRFVMNASTIWQTEAVVYLMVASTLLGLPYVQLLRGHVNVDLLPMMLPLKAQRILQLLTLFVTLLVIGVIAFYGFELFYDAWSRNWKSDSVWGVRLWIPYLSLPLGFGLFFLQLAADFFLTMNERVA